MTFDQETRIPTPADIRKAVNRLGGELPPPIDHGQQLDEIAPKKMWDRFGERDKLLAELAAKKLWGLNQQVFITVLNQDEETKAVIASEGLTKCVASPAIDFTPNLICFNNGLQEATEFSTLPQQDRINKFDEKICNAETFVIFAHGWDGRSDLGIPTSADLLDLNSPEEYAELARLMAGNPRLFDFGGPAPQVPDQADVFELTQQLNHLKGKVALISLGVMGSQKSLNENHRAELTENGIKTQLFEAIDRIGIAITESKMKQITSKSWQANKKQLVDDLYKELAIGIENGEDAEQVDILLNKLCYLFQTEYSVANGTWWYENVGVVMGHSMGGNINMRAFIDVTFGQEVADEYADYRKKMNSESNKTKSRIAEVDQLNDKLTEWQVGSNELATLVGPNFTKSFDRLAKTFGGFRKEDLVGFFVKEAKSSINNEDLWEETGTVKDRVPNATFLALQPVLGGDDATDPPSWFIELKERLQKKESAHVLLEKDRLLSTINKIPFRDVRSLFMSIGAKLPILFAKVSHFTGVNMNYKRWIDELYVYGNVADGAYHEHSKILRKMRPFAPDDIFTSIGRNEMSRAKVYFGNPNLETTLSAAYGEIFERLMRRGESNGEGAAAEAVRTYIRHLPTSGHHYSGEDMPIVKADMYAGIIAQQREKQKKLARMLSKVQERVFTYN